MTAKRLPCSVLVIALLVPLGLAAFPAETVAPAPQGAAAAGLQGFDEFAASVMGEWKIPGVAVGAIRDGKVVLAKGYGYRDVAKQLPVTPRTLMAIGSNSSRSPSP